MPLPHSPALSHLLYLHGFRSSPQSAKARLVAQWMQQHQPHVTWLCPQLPPSPREAMALIQRLVADWPDAGSAVVGSSLGGFYAAAVAAQRGWRAVLLNPAVDPARDLAAYIGEQTVWQQPQDRFFFRPEFIGELQAIDRATRQAEAQRQQQGALSAAFALIARGDEVLDWNEMSHRYAHAQQKVLQESNHALSDFVTHWPDIATFLSLATT